MGLRNVTIDDRNTSLIHFSGLWTRGTYFATATQNHGTISTAEDTSASFAFDTIQSVRAFYYYGIPRSAGGFYKVCVDCDGKVLVDFSNGSWQTIDGVNRTDDGKNPPIVLFSKQWSDLQRHIIVVTNQPDARFNNQSEITLDRLVITVFNGNDTSEPPADSFATPTSSSTSLKASGRNGRRLILIEAVVPTVVVTVLLALILVILLVRQRRRQNDERTEDGPTAPPPQTARRRRRRVRADARPNRHSPQRETRAASSQEIKPSEPEAGNDSARPEDPRNSNGNTTLPPPPEGGQGGGANPQSEREEDAGSIHVDANDQWRVPDDLPPDYSAAIGEPRVGR